MTDRVSGLRKASRHIFILPQDHDSPSGGNWYNRFLIDALLEQGVVLDVWPLDQALTQIPVKGEVVFWVDTLCTELIVRENALLRGRPPVFLIVHHLKSLETDLSPKSLEEESARDARVFESVTGFLTTSPLVFKSLRSRGYSREPVFLVPPALCIRPAGRVKKKSGFCGLIAANLVPRKGIIEFLSSLREKIVPDDIFEIRIAGREDIDPSYSRLCREIVEETPMLERSIRLCGALSLEEMKKLYEECTVFLSASKMETFGMAVQEAGAFGLPILAVDAGYVGSHVIQGINGYLYKDAADLAEACIRFLRDPVLLTGISQYWLDEAVEKHYTWTNAARLFLAQFETWREGISDLDPGK